MELTYINAPLPKINKRHLLLVFVLTLIATFFFYGSSVYFVGLLVSGLMVIAVYHRPEFGIAVLVNGLYLVGFFWRGIQIPYLVTPLAVALSTLGLAHYVFNHEVKWRGGILPFLVILMGMMLLE